MAGPREARNDWTQDGAGKGEDVESGRESKTENKSKKT